jgi:hypothetical protein
VFKDGTDVDWPIRNGVAMVRNRIATSPTVRAIAPTWSIDSANDTTPDLFTRPYVGLQLATPQNAAGRVIEPPVCDASAPRHMPHATAAAEPLLDPPGVRDKSQGFRVGGGSKLA